ncbi:unnamed protein product, partial [Meganyctiphanes norvegica]
DCFDIGVDCDIIKAYGLCVLYKGSVCKRTCDGCGSTVPTVSTSVGPTTTTTDICRLPMVIGDCKAAMPRFHFNYKSGNCRKFTYGGCTGNANNFRTRQECRDMCKNSDFI